MENTKYVACPFVNLYIIYMHTKAFWNRVKMRIREKAVTQEDAAKAAGLSPGRFRMWMSRGMVPPLSYAYRLAMYLGVSLEYLISGKGDDSISIVNEEILVLLDKASKKLIKIRRYVSEH